MRTLISTSAVIVAVCGVANVARAQSIEEALSEYKAKNYAESAVAFYNVLANDANPDNRDQAQIYLAEALRKMELYFPALYYYQDIFSAGKQNRYYVNAIEGLLAIHDELHDPVFVPIAIDQNFDPEGFGLLSPDKISAINYMIGEFSFRRSKNDDAKLFLEYVPPESAHHNKARYLLGIIAIRKNKPEDALAHFKAIIGDIPVEETDADKAELRDLAAVAAGRTAYGLGRYAEASTYYARVPRYSEAWFSAMYENAWAYFRQEDYGRSLGELESVVSPFFAKRHVPEAFVIQGTAYFANCQWDRVRRSVSRYKETYEPMNLRLSAYLAEARDSVNYYRDVVADGAGNVDLEAVREVRRSKRFLDYHFMITHMDWELAELDRITLWQGHSLQAGAKEIIQKQREQLEPVVGAWVKRRLTFLRDQLTNFQNQINILDFEVTDAERQWLEQGKEINKGLRARQPRPEIPNDQWQHWSFNREFWRDELGYFQHSLRSECN